MGSLDASNVHLTEELQRLYDSTKEELCQKDCISSLTNIAEAFVELERCVKELFGPGISVTSALLVV